MTMSMQTLTVYRVFLFCQISHFFVPLKKTSVLFVYSNFSACVVKVMNLFSEVVTCLCLCSCSL